jgi:NitT/TauT family transport system substrate-binding protein
VISRRRALGLAAAAPLAFAAARVRAQSVHIRIGAGVDDAFMQPYYAQELGLFKKANLDVEIVQAANAGAIAAAAAGGAVDIGMSEPTALALANARGLPFAYFAGGPLSVRDEKTLVLVAAKNSPIRSAKDLEGKTVAIISLRTLMANTVMEWLRINGADGSKVKFFELHFPEMAPALQRGVVDAALLGEPFLTENKDDVHALGVPFDVVAKVFYIFGWFARRDWVAANTETAHKLASVFYDVARWGNAHHAESAAIESKVTKVPVEIVRTMARNPMSTELNPAWVQPVLDIGTRYKILDRQVSASEMILAGFS